MNEQPKYKKEIRAALVNNINRIKNVYFLKDILKIVDIYARAADEEEFKTVTDKEWNIKSIVTHAITCEDEQSLNRLSNLSLYVTHPEVRKAVLKKNK